MKFTDLIANIVNGFEIKKGSLVLLHFWGENSDLEVLDKFTIEIAKAGGIPIRWQQSKNLIKDYYTEVSEENLEFPDKYFEIFKIADVVIDILMYSPKPHEEFPRNKMPLLGGYMRKLFGALTQDKEKFIQIKIPTVENALSMGIDYEIYNDAVINALNIDYTKIKNTCEEIVNKLKNKNKVAIYTGDNKKLTFNLQDRQWYKDDGTGDIPCGEVYIAPIEESTDGEIVIPEFFLEGDKFTDVLMEFKYGKLINCSSSEVLEYVQSAPGDSDIIAEFGIGLNEGVQKLIGCAAIDEKCIGTAHIAVGMNNVFGGKNESPLHIDFVFTPVKIEIDDIVLMNDSKEIL